jgi:ribosomal protein S18 acetylase RimI-like enzyme
MDVRIRLGKPDDVDAISDLYLQSAHYHATEVDPAVFDVPERGDVLASVGRMLASDNPAILVAADAESRPVGYAIVLMNPAQAQGGTYRDVRYAFVDDLAVAQGIRGQGVGTQLLRAAEAWARDRGAEAMLLDTHPNNVRALRFYHERMGYQNVGVRLVRRLD